MVKLMKRRSRSLAMWGQASTPSLAEPEVTRLDRHAREVTCRHTTSTDHVDIVDTDCATQWIIVVDMSNCVIG